MSDQNGLLIGLLVLAIGVCLTWFAKQLLEIDDPSLLVLSLLVVSLIAYATVSGKLTELTGPGGISAKFKTAAGARVSSDSGTIDAATEDLSVLQKGSVGSLESRLATLNQNKPHQLVLRMDGRSYDADALKAYLYRLRANPAFLLVTVVNADGTLVGYAPHADFWAVLEDDDAAGRLVQMLSAVDVDGLAKHPVFRTIAVRPGTTNLEALRTMARNRVEAMLVLTEDDVPIGIVERDRLVPELLVALTD